MSDVALVTPLKDGMNLVAKEYCACQIEGNGVLVLSEFAGAAEQLGQWAVLVNPYDLDGGGGGDPQGGDDDAGGAAAGDGSSAGEHARRRTCTGGWISSSSNAG